MRRSLIVGLMLLAVSCGGPQDDPANPADPAYPGSEVISPTHSGGSCCFYPTDGEARRPVLMTDYGTNDGLDRVLDFSDGLRFSGEGGGPTGGGVVRWVGVRDGTATTWRKVDLATGAVGGHPNWEAVVTVMAHDCH